MTAPTEKGTYYKVKQAPGKTTEFHVRFLIPEDKYIPCEIIDKRNDASLISYDLNGTIIQWVQNENIFEVK